MIYFSGSCGITKAGPWAEPEITIWDTANVMLSYYLITTDQQCQHKRWPKIRLVRKRGRKTVGIPTAPNWEELEVGCVKSHFLDSGSFSLRTRAAEFAKEHQTDEYAFYATKAFWAYMDSYAEFIKKYHYGIDYYANVDVIPNPELTWRNQKYLEDKHGLKPVPVVHYRTDLKWLKHYVEKGYKYIGLGGLVGSSSQDACRSWIDRCFNYVCDNPQRLPCVKLHGFGITGYELMVRYPFASVDSAAWTKVAAFGNILVPHKRKGKFTFDIAPYVVPVSYEHSMRGKKGAHYLSMHEGERSIITEWLNYIQMPVGKLGPNDEVLEYGVVTRHTERRGANLLFYEAMRQSLPKYPWPFVSKRRRGFGLL